MKLNSRHTRILIKNANVFDGKHSQLQNNRKLIITDNLVTEVCTGDIAEDSFDVVLDAKGRTAIPGLTDAHVHFGHTFMADTTVDYDVAVSVAVAKKLLYKGFTTVRDAGGISMGIKKAIDQKVIEGPRIYPSNSFLSQTCGHGDSAESHEKRDIQYRIPTHGVLADGKDEVVRAVREQLYRGASQIKLMAGGGCASRCDPIGTVQYSLEEMKAAVEAAADYGTYVMAHLYTAESMKRAAKAGIRSFEHGHLLDEEVAKAAADQGIFITPMPQFSKKECELSHIGDFGRKPEEWEEPRENKSQVLMEGLPKTNELILKYDLKVLFGTDLMITYPYYDPRDSYDLTQYKRRFGSYKGLLAATGNVNDLIKYTTYQNPYKKGEIGVLKEGAYADLLLVDGNPVEDLDILADTDNLHLIMKDGIIYKNLL
jgi:imidazolonepropionase-like amidohydrolase